MSYGYGYAYGYGRPAPAGGFDPSTLFANGEQGVCYTHWKPGTLWQDSARTIPAQAAEDPIECWDDVSGNGHHAVHTGGATTRGQLALTDSVLSPQGREGAAGGLISDTVDLSGTDRATLILALNAKGDTGGKIIAELGTSFNVAGAWYASLEQGLRFNLGGPGTSSRSRGSALTGWHIVTVKMDRANPPPAFSIDRVNITGATGGTGVIEGNFGSYPLSLFSRWTGSVSTFPSAAALKALLLIDRALTPEEIASFEAEAARRCGIVLP